MNRSRITGDLVSQNNIFVDIANDRVGIGTTQPTHKVDLNGTLKIHDGSGYQNHIVYTSNPANLNFPTGPLANLAKTPYLSFGDRTSGGDFKIYHDHYNVHMKLTGIGGFHIGNASTSGVLQINGSNGSGGVRSGVVLLAGNEGVKLYHGSTAVNKFETVAYGVTVHGTTETQELNVTGVTTATGEMTVNSTLTAVKLKVNSTNAQIDLTSGQNSFTRFGAINHYHNNSTSTIHNQIKLAPRNGGTGRIMFYNLTGGTLTERLRIDGTDGIQAIAHITPMSDNLYALGGTSTRWSSVTSKSLFLIDTDAGSAAGPEFKLFRNSASPADADYLGQIKFAGESDTGVERNYAKITGKILDASNGTEDGIIEFAHIKAGSQTITGRWRSDSLQLLNGTSLTVAGTLDVDGQTDLDVLNVSDTATFSGRVTIATHTHFNFGSNNDNYITQGSSGNTYFRTASDIFLQINNSGHLLPGTDSQYNIGSNTVRFANIYADTLYGDGSNLTGITQTTINSNADNRIITGSGTANTLNAESTLTFSSRRLTSGGLTLNDDGVNGAILQVYADDQNPWAFNIGNSTYQSNGGLYGYQANNGDFLLRLVGNSEYKSFTFEQFNGSSNRSWASFGNGGNVKLFYQGSEKLATTNSGVDVTGRLTADDLTIENTSGNLSGYFTATNGLGTLEIGGSTGAFIDLKHPATDDYDMRLGVSGSNGYINTANNFNLYVKANENAIYAAADAGVFLYFNGSNKFQTIQNGIKVENTVGNTEIRSLGTGGNRADVMILQTGTADANLWLDASNGDLAGADYANIKHETSSLDLTFTNYANDIKMYVRGGSIGAGGLRQAFHAHENGAVDLYHNGNNRLQTSNTGINISGSYCVFSGAMGSTENIKIANTTSGGYIQIGMQQQDSDGLHHRAYIRARKGGASIAGKLELLARGSGGGTDRGFFIDAANYIESSLTIIPTADNSYDLGSSSRRWRNVYTADLHFSNKGSKNDVDGTWGNYTIQEGESDLFLINNRNGKKYKFNLTEVS